MSDSWVNIELIGGPYDGCEQMVRRADAPVPDEFEMPVNTSLIRCLSGSWADSVAPTGSVASYKLRVEADREVYAFQGARAIGPDEAVELQEWCEEMLDAVRRGRDQA